AGRQRDGRIRRSEAAEGRAGEERARQLLVEPRVRIVDGDDEVLLAAILDRILPGVQHLEAAALRCREPARVLGRRREVLEEAQGLVEELADRVVGLVARVAE